jgi:TRAP-type C4-dicarboxylate transport system permease small subunit
MSCCLTLPKTAASTPAALAELEKRMSSEEGRIFTAISAFTAVIGGLGILALVGLTVVGVFWRYVLNTAIFGLSDITILTAAVVAACAVAYGALHGAHVAITLIDDQFGPKVQPITDLLAHTLSAAILALACYALIDKSACGRLCGDMTDNFAILHRPFYWVLAVSMAICVAHRLYLLWRTLFNNKQNAEG